MSLFGRAFDAQEIFGLVSLLTVLAFWIVAWRRERGWAQWFKGWEAGRKARRDAELAAGQGEGEPPSDGPRGPWG